MAKTKVLILCTGNSCRSQMAEGILRHYGGEGFEVASAGSQPGGVNEIAIDVMKEIGIDISGHQSKHWSQFAETKFDYVITVCDHAKQACPILPGCIPIHMPFPDPPHRALVSEEVIEEFREVRDMILERFQKIAETGVVE